MTASLQNTIERVRLLLQERYGDRIPLALVHTYGCQQNVSDGERLKGLLALMGYGFCERPEEAELILYNTCAVRENAEDRVFGNVGALKGAKRRNPGLIIGLCGCMVQQEHIAEKLKKSYPYVDLVFGTHVLSQLPEMLLQLLGEKRRVFNLSQEDAAIPEGLPIRRDPGVKAFLPVMYGCDNFCSYCVVPYVRGRERSRKPADILAEFRELLAAGYKDITLLGQNVNSYGRGLEEEISFAGLLRLLNKEEGDFRLRFMTSHPKDATFALIDTMAQCEKVCKHFHLPVQSGSDRILREMNRRYTTADYLRLIAYARERLPGITFTTDIIVGFPGETEEDFEQTLALLKRVRYDSIFSFIYSKRVGTRAASMEDPTPPEEKSRRFQRLLEVQREIGAELLESRVGSVCRVLAEGPGRSGEGWLTGRNEDNLIVDFPGGPELVGQFVTVRIEKALSWALQGRVQE